MQELYNWLERDGDEELEMAKRYGLGVLAYSPLAQGVLTSKYLGGAPQGSRATYAPDLLKRYTTLSA